MNLLDEYRKAAADHGKYTYEGNANATNSAYERIQRIFAGLVDSNNDVQLFLLYEDPDSWIQGWAATHTLELDEARALRKLTELTNLDSLVGLDAEFTIEEWKKGKLRFRTPGR